MFEIGRSEPKTEMTAARICSDMTFMARCFDSLGADSMVIRCFSTVCGVFKVPSGSCGRRMSPASSIGKDPQKLTWSWLRIGVPHIRHFRAALKHLNLRKIHNSNIRESPGADVLNTDLSDSRDRR